MTENPSSYRRYLSRLPVPGVLPLLIFALFLTLPTLAWTKKGKKPAKEKGSTSEKSKPSKAELSAVKAAAKARKSLAKARTLRDKGKIEMALVEFQSAIDLDPSYAEAYLEMGGLYFDSNLPDPAAQALELGIPLARQQGIDAVLVAQAYCQLAESYRRIGRLNEALDQAKSASEVAPQDALPWKISGATHLDSDNEPEALKSLQEAVRLDPQFVEAWELLGQVALRRKDEALAQRVYEGLYRCDTFKADLYKTDMNQSGLKAAAPPKTKPVPPSAHMDDPYAIGPATAPASFAAPATAGEPKKATATATVATQTIPRPAPPTPPVTPTRPVPAKVVRPAGQKTFTGDEPPLLSLPTRPTSPVRPTERTSATTENASRSAAIKPTTAFRSAKPLDPSDTLLTEVIPSGATTTMPILDENGEPAASPPTESEGSAGDTMQPPSETSDNDDPYAPPHASPPADGEAATSEAGDTTPNDSTAADPTLPDGEGDGSTTSSDEPALPMLPEDQVPAPAAAVPGANTDDELIVVASTGSDEIPEDRIFALFSNLSSPDADIADGARKRLVGFGAAAAPHLMQRLSDSNPLVRLRVMQTLGDLGGNAQVAVDQIRKLSTSDPDPKVRQEAQKLVQSLTSSR
ncbi:MAG TPA: tetratricopeptide repeat protein [Candidatus Ozemobacteraceae bacterium]|nr:tetratricopeptide repeat protein [Candidatus Ozemobacteraceae bacterium]